MGKSTAKLLKITSNIILGLIILLVITGCSQYIRRPKTNIKITKQTISKESEITARGYLIFKTKSCSFTNINSSQHPLETQCAPNSGYVILSDENTRDWDFASQKTFLADEQILIYYVPDKIIEELNLNGLYKIQGSVSKYNGIEALKFNALL